MCRCVQQLCPNRRHTTWGGEEGTRLEQLWRHGQLRCSSPTMESPWVAPARRFPLKTHQNCNIMCMWSANTDLIRIPPPVQLWVDLCTEFINWWLRIDAIPHEIEYLSLHSALELIATGQQMRDALPLHKTSTKTNFIRVFKHGCQHTMAIALWWFYFLQPRNFTPINSTIFSLSPEKCVIWELVLFTKIKRVRVLRPRMLYYVMYQNSELLFSDFLMY